MSGHCPAGSIVFVMNFRHEPVELTRIGEWTDAETKEKVSGILKLEKLSCRILTAGLPQR